MNSQKQSVEQAVKAYYASKVLSESQLHALHETLECKPLESQHGRPSVLKMAGVIAVSLLIFIAAFGYMQTPAVITAAYHDVIKDADIHNGLQPSMSEWIRDHHIDAVPDKYQVEMSKRCDLEQYKTTHLRVAGVERGKLHLFFHQGERPLHWLSRSGNVDNMNWKLIKVRSDLTLIVMYTHDMREQAVHHILDEMLPGISA